MPLDTRTLLVVVTTVALLMAFWTCVMAWGEPAEDALWALALALCAYAGSNVLFALHGQIPTVMTVGVGNAAYAVALALMLRAVRRFQGAAIASWMVWVPIILIPLLTGPLAGQFRARAVISSTLYTMQIAFILQALLDRRHPIAGRGRYILLVAYGALATILALRGLAIGTGWLPVDSVVDSNKWQALLFLVATCAVMSISLGFVYMHMERAERRNYELAMQDALTGLANRRAITDELYRAVSRAERQGLPLSVLMLDVDHFKRINDNCGHQSGDAVLRAIGQTLRTRLRGADAIGRFGGEEFLAVLPDTNLAGALTLAEALRAAVEAGPVPCCGRQMPVTISIGVACDGTGTPEALVAAADSAMYRAKQAGRNRVAT